MATFDDFSKLDLKLGRIIEVNQHPDAEKLYVLKVDMGEKTVQIVAGIKPFYQADELSGKMVAVLANLEPKSIRGTLSEGMILAAQGKDDVSLVVSDKAIEPGSAIK